MKIAIDGPAGAGKSTVSRKLAEKFGYIYVDTGALYRALAYKCITNNILINEECIDFLQKFTTELRLVEGVQRVIVGGEDVTDFIRTPEISKGSSEISAIPAVRDFLLNLQRDIAEKNSVVMDGRDIGTVILPDAEVKIFLTATPEERARRRFEELKQSVPFEEILEDIVKRDYADMHREIAPLKQAEDAILVDTTNLTQAEVIDKLFEICNSKRA